MNELKKIYRQYKTRASRCRVRAISSSFAGHLFAVANEYEIAAQRVLALLEQ